MNSLIIDCLEKDWDREFLYSIKELDIKIVVESVVEFVENPTINDLIYEAIDRYVKIICNSDKYEDFGVKLTTDWDDYVSIYLNGLATKVNFKLDKFRQDYVDCIEDEDERENLIDLIGELDWDLTHFRYT